MGEKIPEGETHTERIERIYPDGAHKGYRIISAKKKKGSVWLWVARSDGRVKH